MTTDRDGEIYVSIDGTGVVRCQHCARKVDFSRSCTIMRAGGPDGRCQVTRCGGCSLTVDSDASELFAEVVGALVQVFGVDETRAHLARALGGPLPKGPPS